ncbi:uncharacterized protein DMAD_02137 [Drosophila madeirensis]|uniref:Uncharacterized protein n=1 Tax=Drosophila madeirensis TaxID=30013 RepID=A0AAU9G441_DROMD
MSSLVEWLVGKANHRVLWLLPVTPQAASNANYQSKPGPSLGSHKCHVLTAVVLPGTFWNICIHPCTVMRRQMAWKNLEIQEPATSWSPECCLSRGLFCHEVPQQATAPLAKMKYNTARTKHLIRFMPSTSHVYQCMEEL